MSAWTCPRCDRSFGRANQQHVCLPAMSVDEWFAGRPAVERSIHDAVAAHLGELDSDGDLEIEAVEVGILFKRTRTFAELRPRRDGLGLSIVLPHDLDSPRVRRRMKASSDRTAVVIVLAGVDDVDAEVKGWLNEAFLDT